jgi:hypothetical protein
VFIIYNVQMSISDLLHKIKGSSTIDKSTILYLLVVIGVGVSAFGLGRLSVKNSLSDTADIQITQTAGASMKGSLSSQHSPSNPVPQRQISSSSQSGIEKNYIASKNGKLYYTPGCSGTKRIKPANEVWFATASDAEASGYARSASCK